MNKFFLFYYLVGIVCFCCFNFFPLIELNAASHNVFLFEEASDSHDSVNPKDSHSILNVASRVIRVESFPLNGKRDLKNGKLHSGYGYDYMQHLQCYTSWSYQYSNEYLSWIEMMPKLEKGELDMVFCVQKTEELEKKFAFSKHSMGETSSILTVKAGNKKYLMADYKNWNGIRVGLIKSSHWGDAFRLFAKKNGFTFHPVYYNSIDQMLSDLMDGIAIDAAVTNDLRTLENEWIYEQFGKASLFVAVRKNDITLLNELNTAMSQMNELNPKINNQLHQKYYVFVENEQIPFTEKEKNLIKEMNESEIVLTGIMNPDRAPFSYYKDGKYYGSIKDIADEIIKRTGLKVKFIPLHTREDYYQLMNSNNEVDIVFDFYYDLPNAEKYQMHLTDPYLTSSISLLHRKEKSRNFQSLAFVTPSNEPKLLPQYFDPSAKLITCKTLNEAINLVVSKQCDALFLHTRCAEYAARVDLHGVLAVQLVPNIVNRYAVAVRKGKNPLLFSIINKAVCSIDNDFISAANFKNIAPIDDQDILSKMINRHIMIFVSGVIVSLIFFSVIFWFILKSRKQIRNEKIFIQKTFQSVNEGLIVMNSQGQVIDLNPIAEQILECSKKEVYGKNVETIFQIIDTNNEVTQNVIFKTAIRSHKASSCFSNVELVSLVNKKQYHIEYSVNPILSDSKNKIGILLVFRDMTAAYARQSEMQSEIMQWEAVSQIAQIYKFRFNFDSYELFGNIPPAFLQTQKEMRLNAQNWVHPEDLADWYQKYDDLCSGKQLKIIFNHRSLLNGECQHFRVFMHRESLQSKWISGVVQNITEMVRSQVQQDAMMRLFKLCVNSAPFMFYIKSVKDFRILQCNDRFAKFFNKNVNDIEGKKESEIFENFPFLTLNESDKKTIENKGNYQCHECFTDYNGNTRYFTTIKSLTSDADGEPILVCISIDETNEYLQKIALENLLKNRDAAAELANIVTYQINYKTWEITGCKQLDEYWSVVDGKALPAEFVVIPDDVDICKQQYAEIIKGTKEVSTIEYRRKKADGLHYYRLNLRKSTNIPDCITGLIIDITETMLDKNKREALYHLWNAVATSIPAILFVKDADDDFKYLYANKNLSLLLDRKNSELIGHSVDEFVPADEARRIKISDLEAMNSETPTECYELIRDANGKDHHFRSIKIPSINEFGHRIMIQMTTDISNVQELLEVRKIVSNAFEKLFFGENLEEGIQSILKQICEFIGFSRGYVTHVDQESNEIMLFTYYLQPGEQLMFKEKKFTMGDASNQKWYQHLLDIQKGDAMICDFKNEKDCQNVKEYMPRLWELKEPFDIRGLYTQYLVVNEKPWGYVNFVVQHENSKTYSENEKILLKMASNIIELAITRHYSFINLQNAIDSAKVAAETKSNFLATISHEIRTPLNAVLGFADLLQDKSLDPKMHQEYLENISSAGHILLGLINDILDMSKLSANKMVFVPVSTSILDLLSQVGILFRPKCRSKNIHFIGSVPKEFPLVWIDMGRMRQILFNLIGNAVKFTDFGSVTVSAEFVKKTDQVGDLSIYVIDTGCGISVEDLKNLFQPFYQAQNIRGTATGNAGTGLGLSICKKMLEGMGGKLDVESELGKGSTFIARLYDIKYEDHPHDEQSINSTDNINVDDHGFSEFSVLIVDDVPLNLMVLQAVLKKMKVSVDSATNASDAWKKLLIKKYDFVLTDLWMPEMNGVEFAQKIHQSLKSYQPRIAVITADVDGDSHFDFSVFDAVLTKPVTPASIQRFFDLKK